MFEALPPSLMSTTSVRITMSQHHPDFDAVFPETEESRLRVHITILTSALKSVEVEPVPSTDRVHDRKILKIFSYISTLLTIGTPEDPWSNRLNAVSRSGSVDHDRIVSIISIDIHDSPTMVPDLRDSNLISSEKVLGMGNDKQLVKE